MVPTFSCGALPPFDLARGVCQQLAGSLPVVPAFVLDLRVVRAGVVASGAFGNKMLGYPSHQARGSKTRETRCGEAVMNVWLMSCNSRNAWVKLSGGSEGPRNARNAEHYRETV